MAAGIFGYMGYDTVRLIERLPNKKPDSLGLPDSILVRPTLIVIFDSVKDEMTVVTPVRPAPGVSAKAAYARAGDRSVRAAGAARPASAAYERDRHAPHPEGRRDRASGLHGEGQSAKDYIAAGDIFQVVLSQSFEAPFTLPSFALYRALRRVNPSPFLYYLNFGRFAVVGSSPEILVRVRDGAVTIRPIADAAKGNDAGGRREPRQRASRRHQGARRASDAARPRPQRCRARGRDRHRHRHRPFFLEYYSQVMHIVSNVEALHGGFDAVDALMAGFPAGRCPARQSGPWRSSTNWRIRPAVPMRVRRLLLGRRRDGQLHRAQNFGGQGRDDV